MKNDLTSLGQQYWHKYLLTGAWSGQADVVQVAHLSLFRLLTNVTKVNWQSALDFVFVTHVWFGSWSFLQLRSWMYHFYQILAVVAAGGLVILAVRTAQARTSLGIFIDGKALAILVGFLGFFSAAIGFHVLVVFTGTGASASLGWYIYAVVIAEVLLVVMGLMTVAPAVIRPWTPLLLLLSFMALELYATHFVLIPYYSGMIHHRPSGNLGAFYAHQLSQNRFFEVWSRLAINKPAAISRASLLVLWIGYILATITLGIVSASAVWRMLQDQRAGARIGAQKLPD